MQSKKEELFSKAMEVLNNTRTCARELRDTDNVENTKKEIHKIERRINSFLKKDFEQWEEEHFSKAIESIEKANEEALSANFELKKKKKNFESVYEKLSLTDEIVSQVIDLL